MKTLKLWLLATLILSCLSPILLHGQAGELIEFDDLFNGFYQPKRPASVTWTAQGNAYSILEKNELGQYELVQYDCLSGESELLIGNELLQKVISGSSGIQSFEFYEEDALCLLFTNTRRVWRENTRGDYWLYDANKKSMHQLGKSLPESSLMFAKIDPEAKYVAYVSGHNLYKEELKSGKIQQLTFDGSEDIINGTFDWAYEEEFFCKDGFRWSPDGKYLAFWKIDASGIPDYLMINTTDSLYAYTKAVEYPKVGAQPSSARIGIIDMSNDEILFPSLPGDPHQHYLPRAQWINDQQFLIQQLSRRQNELKFWLWDIGSNEGEYVYEEKAEDAWVDIVLFDPSLPWTMDDLDILEDGRSLIRITDKDGWRHLYKINLEDGSTEDLTPGAYDIANKYLIDESQEFAYINASPTNNSQRYLYRTAFGKKAQKISPEEYTGVNNYHISPNGKFAIHSFSSSREVPVHQLISLPDHRLIRVLEENEEIEQKLNKLLKPNIEFFSVTTEDNIEVEGRMILPPDFNPDKKYPILFHVYGEPAGQMVMDAKGRMWDWYLAQQGYIVATMDNRGSAGLRGRAWRKSIYKKVGVINARDQAMATKEVIKKPFIDEERVAVWGWSGGGSMTLNLLFKYPEIYKTGMSVAPVANQLFYNSIYQERYMGLPQDDLAPFIEGSPITHASKLEGNLLLVHGTADDNVHYQNAEALINELIKENKLFQVMPYPNRSHGIFEGENTRRHLYTLLTSYLSTHMKAGPSQEKEEAPLKLLPKKE